MSDASLRAWILRQRDEWNRRYDQGGSPVALGHLTAYELVLERLGGDLPTVGHRIESQAGELRLVCGCGGSMRPEVGRLIGPDAPTWLWYRCETNRDHLTAALPIPEDAL